MHGSTVAGEGEEDAITCDAMMTIERSEDASARRRGLAVATVGETVVVSPGGALGRARLGEVMALTVQTTVLATGRGETAHLAGACASGCKSS